MHAAHRVKTAAALALLGAVLAAPARADDADEAFFQRASECAAAMQVDQYALVARARAGEPDLRPPLFEVTRLGFAYVGEAYLKGLRDPRATDMLKAAIAQQKDWPAARHKAMVAECRIEAQKIYDNSGMWKMLVDSRANKRVDRFLSMPPLPPASAPAN